MKTQGPDISWGWVLLDEGLQHALMWPTTAFVTLRVLKFWQVWEQPQCCSDLTWLMTALRSMLTLVRSSPGALLQAFFPRRACNPGINSVKSLSHFSTLPGDFSMQRQCVPASWQRFMASLWCWRCAQVLLWESGSSLEDLVREPWGQLLSVVRNLY